jgi:hypothetical protein
VRTVGEQEQLAMAERAAAVPNGERLSQSVSSGHQRSEAVPNEDTGTEPAHAVAGNGGDRFHKMG